MARAFASASSQYLNNANAVISGPPFTIHAWAMVTNAANNNYTVFTITDESATVEDGYEIVARGGSDIDDCQFIVRSGGSVVLNMTSGEPGADWSVNAWSAFGVVSAATNDWTAYLDGSSNNSTTTATVSGLAATKIGVGWSGALSNYFDGRIAEVGVWDTNLTDAEMQILNMGVSPLLVRPQSLVAYWPLIGRTSPEIDLVGGYDMTLTNAPTTAAHPAVMYPSEDILVQSSELYIPRPGTSIQGGVWMV